MNLTELSMYLSTQAGSPPPVANGVVSVNNGQVEPFTGVVVISDAGHHAWIFEHHFHMDYRLRGYELRPVARHERAWVE